MDPGISELRIASSSLSDDESEFHPERELASCIHRHFSALAEVLNRSAELLGETPDGARLRAAASAARRGQSSAERLYAKIRSRDAQDIAVRRRA